MVVWCSHIRDLLAEMKRVIGLSEYRLSATATVAGLVIAAGETFMSVLSSLILSVLPNMVWPA